MRPSLFPLLAIAALGISTQGCSDHPNMSKSETIASSHEPQKQSDGITYSIVDEKIFDKAIKTQIEQHILASPIPTKDQLRAELLRRYEAAIGRRGFAYHNTATNIYIYIYGSKEQAEVRQGLWIGMIARSPMDGKDPQPDISVDRLAALSSKPEERFGLSEVERKVVFKEMTEAENRAREEAMVRVPDTAVLKQIDLERKLQLRYKAIVARKHRPNAKEFTAIAVEGVTKGWPM